MKKIILCFTLLSFALTLAQEEVASDDLVQLRGHEVSLNLLDFIAAGAIDVQYEHYLSNNQSAQLSFTAFDNYGYHEVGYIEDNNTHSLAASYKFYMGKKDHAGIFFYPYVKYMFGKQTFEDFYYYDEQTNETHHSNYEMDMNNLSFGIGMGYKWVFSKNYTLGVDAAVGRTFNSDIKDMFSEVEFKAGISFGYRF